MAASNEEQKEGYDERNLLHNLEFSVNLTAKIHLNREISKFLRENK
jgi:hypothetical protein